MQSNKLDKALLRAEQVCRQSGSKLTSKRRNVLQTLLNAGVPLSAYELADHYQQQIGEVIPVMSVYRMLDFLAQENLVHRLSSSNKYVACSHIACSHAHQQPQFLICDRCNKVSEIGIDSDMIAALNNQVKQAGFQLGSPQLELHGLCKQCC